ncbi:MAG: bifunctional hydroxymethylpyrimidine kinase/phosphomethylpyrimidine kinase [Pyrodictiaceae archaeon]
MRLWRVALTIAGSDSGGGAGIEADLKTFAALGVHGTVAITSVTAQNTYEVKAIHDIPPEVVEKQIDAIAEDMGVDAAKTGMLSNSDIIKAVARAVKRHGFPLVVDPVMIAKSGAPLLKPEAVKTLTEELLPLATLVTPNRMEAEKLSGLTIRSLDDAKKAAKKIAEEYGAEAVIVKGGHLEGDESIDVLYHNGVFREYRAPRIKDGCTHGTGCSFSAAITAELAKGRSLEEAIEVAKKFITMAIDYGVRVGKGYCPVNPMAWLEIPAEKEHAREVLEKAIDMLVSHGEILSKYIPEVQMNIVQSISPRYARGVEDVAGILGRIVRYGATVKPAGPIAFGASSHMARAVLAAMKHDPEIRSAANLRFDKRLLEAAEKLGFTISSFDRRREPPEIKETEGASIPWGIEEAAKRARGRIPDIIYDEGDVGKEPQIRVFGRTALEVAEKIIKLLREAEKH